MKCCPDSALLCLAHTGHTQGAPSAGKHAIVVMVSGHQSPFWYFFFSPRLNLHLYPHPQTAFSHVHHPHSLSVGVWVALVPLSGLDCMSALFPGGYAFLAS